MSVHNVYIFITEIYKNVKISNIKKSKIKIILKNLLIHPVFNFIFIIKNKYKNKLTTKW